KEVEENESDAAKEFRRMLAEKRGIFHLHLKVFLGLFDLIGQVHDDWREEISSGKEPYSAESDAQIKELYQMWLSLSGPARQKLEFYERHGPPFEKALHTHLHLVGQEVARILKDWQVPAAQSRRVGARVQKYSLAQLLAGV